MGEGLHYHCEVLIDQLTNIFILQEISEGRQCFTLDLGIVVLEESTIDIYQLNELGWLSLLDCY